MSLRLESLVTVKQDKGRHSMTTLAMPEIPEVNKREAGTLQRRGLFAAVAALAAAVVAKVTEQKVEAGSDGDVVLGGSNTTTQTTIITNNASSGTGLEVIAPGTFTSGVFAEATEFAVWGGILGKGAGYGVTGFAGGTQGIGVFAGSFDGTGLLAQSDNGVPVLAQVTSNSNSNANTIAVYGFNNSSFTGASPGAGGFGVYGLSAKGHGLVGATATAGGAAVAGSANGLAGAYAGLFYGPVVVNGNFTVFGGAKSAAVPHPDGSHRRLYCVESPESWFEDFGKGQLKGGCATVTVDPDFAAVVDLTDYHVFLTGYDDFNLRVSDQSASAFHVVAEDAMSLGRFSWRIVAKRKDIAAPRFETVTVPPEPTLPSIPDIPTAKPPSRTPVGAR
jgi:hypothetical protein